MPDVNAWRRALLSAELEPVRRPDGRAVVSVTVAKAVGLAMSTYVDGPGGACPGGNARPGRERLARELHIGASAVEAANALLIAAGWLKRTARGHTGQTATYAISFPNDSDRRDGHTTSESDRPDNHSVSRASVIEAESVRHSDRQDGPLVVDRDDLAPRASRIDVEAQRQIDEQRAAGVQVGKGLERIIRERVADTFAAADREREARRALEQHKCSACDDSGWVEDGTDDRGAAISRACTTCKRNAA